MKKKSLPKNIILSGFRSILIILFPFITYKYAVNILGVQNIGRVEYAKSIVNYFILFAGLGINTYAARNLAAIRDDKKKLQKFANAVFYINCISTFLSLLLLFFSVMLVRSFRNEWMLILVFSLQIVLSTIGVEWLYLAFENFEYITIRTIVCQLLSLIIMVVFVRNPNDLIMYTITMVIATHGAHFFAFFYASKYCKVQPRFSKICKTMLPAILVLFFNSLAVTIYVNSDITMLGILSGSYAIGIYSAAVKIYSATKTLISSVLNALLPRFTYYFYNNNEAEMIKYTNLVITILITIGLPFVTGIICESKNLLLLVSGSEYVKATLTMQILSIALLFSTVGMFVGSTILLPQKKEKYILISTISAAVVNIFLNCLLLNKMSYLGAAITTLISELVVSIMQCLAARDTLKKLKLSIHDCISAILGVVSISFVCFFVELLDIIYIYRLGLAVLLSVFIYAFILIITKNRLMFQVLSIIKYNNKNKGGETK